MGMDHYNKILAGKVAMPGRMEYTLEEYARKIRDRLTREDRGFYPDNGLIDLLCNAAWLGCEMICWGYRPAGRYYEILAGKIAMPGRMKYSLSEFAHRIANRLTRENREHVLDTEFVDLLSNMAWLGCEQIEMTEGCK